MSTTAVEAEARPDNPGLTDHGPLFDPAEPSEARIWQAHYIEGAASAETTMEMVAAVRFRRSLSTALAGLRTRVVAVPAVRSIPDRVPAIVPTGAMLAAGTARSTGPDWQGRPSAASMPTSAEVASKRVPTPSLSPP